MLRACVIFFFAQIANLFSGSGLHDSPIHVRSNTLSAGWSHDHTNYSYYSLLLR